VRAASERKIGDGCGPAFGEWLEVMEFEPARFAASAERAFESAAALVARPDFAPDGGRNVARVCLARVRARPSVPSPTDLLPLEVIHEQREGAVDNGRVIAVWNRMP
jgi:hypothetical protein